MIADDATDWPRLTSDDRMPIGKHYGKRMRDVPDRYLGWLWKDATFRTFGTRRGVAGQLADYIDRRFALKRAMTPEKKWPAYLRLESTQPHT